MRLRNWVLMGVSALLTIPLFGSTYYGGVEDWKAGDYDYNDIVFSVVGSNLTIHSDSGQWFSAPVLSTSGAPFWNHSSLDGPQDGVGYCIYGGGNCNGGVALDPAAKYLAASATSTGSANDVTFTATGQVVLDVALQITAAKDVIGWYSLSDPTEINWLNSGSKNGSFTFNPGGAFGLVEGNSNFSFYSQDQYGTQDSVSHFAFFDPPVAAAVPEPSALGLLGSALIGISLISLRRRRRTEHASQPVS